VAQALSDKPHVFKTCPPVNN